MSEEISKYEVFNKYEEAKKLKDGIVGVMRYEKRNDERKSYKN